MKAVRLSRRLRHEYKGKWDLLADGGRGECAEGTARSVPPPELRPTIPFGGIFRRVA